MVSAPELRLAPGAVRPQRLDHGDLPRLGPDAGALEIGGGHPLAHRLAAHVEHDRLAHDQTMERKRVDRAAVGIEVARRIDMCSDMGIQREDRVHAVGGWGISDHIDALARQRSPLLLVHHSDRLHLHGIFLVERNLRDTGHA
jgi:hypothetical protein